MATAQPIPAITDLYNSLIRLPCSEREAIGQIEWKLRKLLKQQPSDITTQFGLLQAWLMSGKASEAIGIADQIWERRNQLNQNGYITFAGQLGELGKYEKSIEMLCPFLHESFNTVYGLIIQYLAKSALGAGDVDLLRRLVEWSGRHSSTWRIGRFLEELEGAGLTPYFAGHQRVVRDIVFGRQTGHRYFIMTEEGGAELGATIFLDADRAEYRQIEDAIDQGLENYYERRGVDSSACALLITHSVFPISAHTHNVVG